MNKAVFHLKLLRNYQLVDAPGTYYVTVSYTVTEDSLVSGNYPRYLVPLRVLTADSLKELMDLVPDEKVIVEFEEVRHCFMMGALWEGDVDIDELPVKGEHVLATFDYVENVMRCTNIELIPRTELPFVDINNLIEFRATVIKMLKD